MKSRFDVLAAAADRRRLALFRCCGAGAVLLSLLALNAVNSTNGSAKESAPGDLFAAEIGVPATAFIAPLTSPPKLERVRADVVAARALTKDEFAFSPYYTAEPTGY